MEKLVIVVEIVRLCLSVSLALAIAGTNVPPFC